MHESRRKEDIHIGYIYALCTSVGVDYEIIRHDEDSTDGIMKKRITFPDGGFFDAELRIQLKATSSKSQYREEENTITYKLKAKNYNDLCTLGTSPIILGLLILPANCANWVNWTPEELLIHGCMYWESLSNKERTSNSESVNVTIDKKHVLNGETLLSIMEKIAKDDWV